MEDKKTCSRCYKIKEISLFQTTNGKPRKTCNQCREYSSARDAKRRETKLDLFEELEKSELKEKIKSVLSENKDECLESNTYGIQLQCVLKMEEFEGDEELSKTIATFVQSCDGYSYK